VNNTDVKFAHKSENNFGTWTITDQRHIKGIKGAGRNMKNKE
jgi:hypothetical protein